MPVLVVIPARLGSTRLPRKLLQPLGGVPLVVRVAERVQSFEVADRLVVATDSPEIQAVVHRAGFQSILTSAAHSSGTDRVAEVAALPEFAGFDSIVNLQGDAPFLPYQALIGAMAQLDRFDIGTAATRLLPEEADDPATVKMLIGADGEARSFSRGFLPEATNWRHLGLYAFRRAALERVASEPPTSLEVAEALEQLRAMALGLSIGVATVEGPVGPAVDTEADLEKARVYWTIKHEVTR
jgi:3-deoxy-manno-octulosonate cytidylyltransferase (CMP-KDO synthetase)